MVRTRIIFCLIFFLTSSRLFSMDGDRKLTTFYQQTTSTDFTEVTDHNCNELVATIDKKINNYFLQKGLLRSFWDFLTEHDMFPIIAIIEELKIIPNNKLLDALIKKNDFFKLTIDSFTTLASKNLDNVTYNTLEIVTKSDAQQFMSQLNQLPPVIKEYVMDAAWEKQKDTYDIVLVGHTDIINWFDVCSDANRAATSSDDGTFRVWDLTSGKSFYTISEQAVQGRIYFNEDGSQVATTSICNTDQFQTKIWNIEKQELLYTILPMDGFIRHISFLSEQKMLAVFDATSHNSFPTRMSLCSLDKNTKPDLMKIILIPFRDSEQFQGNKNYQASRKDFLDNLGNPKLRSDGTCVTLSNTLTIQKLNCHSFFLCQKAINNMKQPQEVGTFERLPIYQRSTPHEQEKLMDLFTKKNIALKKEQRK